MTPMASIAFCVYRVLEKQATSCRRKRARLILYCEELRFAKMPGERSVAVPLQAVLEDRDALRNFATLMPLIENPIPSPGLERTGHDCILQNDSAVFTTLTTKIYEI